MYLDALDPVRTSETQLDKKTCRNFAIQGESMLVKTLLEGTRPTLTQTQVMDSKVIHNILWDKQMKDHFLSLIDNGHINIAIYKNLKEKRIHGLQSYFLKTLQKGLKEGESFHNYSTLPFLQHLDDDVRRNFHRKVIDAVTNHYYNFQVDGVKSEYVEVMIDYLENLQALDWALRGRFKQMGAFTKGFDDLFIKNYHILKENRQKNDEVVELTKEMITRQSFQNTRSRYYHFLETVGSNFSSESKKLVKGLVDMCYNESIASTIPGSKYNISIEKGAEDLIQCLEHKGEPLNKEEVLLIPKNDAKFFTWESLANVFLEVDILQKEKRLSRLEALEKYKSHNSIQKPAIKFAKYITLGLGPTLLPGGEGIVKIITTGINFIAGDAVSEKFKRPTQKEVLSEIQQYKGKRKITEKAIKFTSVTK